MVPNIYDECLDMAEAGLRVFPCHYPRADRRCSCGRPLCGNQGKHPMHEGWAASATSDPARIRELWEEHPEANVGVATGAGIVVLDIDPRHDGETGLAELVRVYGELPETLTVRTGSGGWHYYFRTTQRVPNSASRLARGVDTRGEGGLVIAPPSLHVSGGRYSWHRIAPIAELPGWIIRKLAKPEPQRATPEGDIYYVSGERHDRMVQFAGYLRGRAGLSPDAVEAAMVVENLRRCRPPLPESEVRSIAKSTGAWETGPDVTEGPVTRHWPGIVERLRSVQNQGPRIPTGISELDRLCRGGIRPGKVLVLGGAPGAGKTTLAVQIAANLARAGVSVGWLAVDEEAAGIDARLLQSLGVNRDLAEEPDDKTIEFAAANLAGLPLHISEEATVEEIFAQLCESSEEGRRAVFIDSVQTARTDRSESIDNVRERINDVIKTAKALAVRHKAILVMTSELSRGSYRSRKRDDQVEDLAAFKESGSIEYAGQVLVVLRSGEDDTTVHANIPKCRIGRKGSFDLILNYDRATFSVHTVDPMAQWNEHVRQVLEAVQTIPGIGTKELADLTGRRKDDVMGALDELTQSGKVVDKGKRNAHKWHPCKTDEWGFDGSL